MYQLTNSPNIILRLDDNAFIPCSLNNSDYQVYQAWVAKGNMPLAAPPSDNSAIVAASDKSLLIDRANAHVTTGDIVSAVKVLLQLQQGV